MQGNIVLYEFEGEKIPARVVEIYRSSVLVKSINGEYEPIEINEAKIYPIEITPEILEKNGFKCVEYNSIKQWRIIEDEFDLWLIKYPEFDEFLFRNEFLFEFEDFSTNKPLPKTQIPVLYVHELQIVLASCIVKCSYSSTFGHGRVEKEIIV